MCARLFRVLLIAAASLASLAGCSVIAEAQRSVDAERRGKYRRGNPAAAKRPAPLSRRRQNPAEAASRSRRWPSRASLATIPMTTCSAARDIFRANSFANAEKSFRAAVEKHPRDAEAWVGLAASYDRLRRFDLADRAYQEAMRIVGRTPEVLNDQGFSYILRGDYGRAQRTLRKRCQKTRAIRTSRRICGCLKKARATAKRSNNPN